MAPPRQCDKNTMVLAMHNDIKRSLASKKLLFFTTVLGAGLLIIAVLIFIIDPISAIIQYKLRLENGSMLNDLLLSRLMSTKMYLYLFNVTNAEQFMSGDDQKIKLQDIGPFVYQEYRTMEDLEINKDPGIMRYTPKLTTEFILEESIGDPKKINVTVPNTAMLAAAAMISKYPFVVRQIFNMVATSNKLTAFVNIRAYDHIWGYNNSLIQLANRIVPGLIYFKSAGLFERLYDVDVDYRLDIGTTREDKFSVKKATKIQEMHTKTSAEVTSTINKPLVFNDTYEGVAFPPGLTSNTPIYIYRHGLCKTFHLQHVGSRRMYYGGDSFVYHFHNDTFDDRKQCDSTGWCPQGLKDVSSCYIGLPVAVSKSYFLDSDPRLLDKVEGLKPDREIHDTEITIDPKIGVAISGSMALQMNLVLPDVSFNPQTRRLRDTILPVSNVIAKSPPMIKEVQDVLQLMYSSGPYITIGSQLVCTLLGLYLLSYSIRMMYWIRLAQKHTTIKDCIDSKQAQALLVRYE